MCFAWVKKGFLSACRPFFGLDETLLKGPTGSVLLTAVVDPNNGIFHIAYAAIEGRPRLLDIVYNVTE